MLLTPSFRGAAKRRARNPYPRAVVMDSGLLATLGPGMTNVEIELQATLLSGAVGDEADEFGRSLAGEAELLEREPLAAIVDADREGGEVHEGVDGRGRHAGEPAERRHRHQAIADILVHVAVIERGRRLDGGVGGAFLAGTGDIAAVARRLGGQPRVVEGIEERHAGNPERLGDGEALGVDRGSDAADRFG